MKKNQILDDTLRAFAQFLCQKHRPPAGAAEDRWTPPAIDAHIDKLHRPPAGAPQGRPPGFPAALPPREKSEPPPGEWPAEAAARMKLLAITGTEELRTADPEVFDMMTKFADVKSHSEFFLSELGGKRSFAAADLPSLHLYVYLNCFVSFAVSSRIGINQRQLLKFLASLGRVAARAGAPEETALAAAKLPAAMQLLSKLGPRDWILGLAPAEINGIALVCKAVLADHLADLRVAKKNSYLQKYHIVDSFVLGQLSGLHEDERLMYKVIRYTIEAFYLAVESFCELTYVNYHPQEYSYKTILINKPKDLVVEKKLLIYLYEANDTYRLFCSYERDPRPIADCEQALPPDRTDRTERVERPSLPGHVKSIYRALAEKHSAGTPEGASPCHASAKQAPLAISAPQPSVSVSAQPTADASSPTREARVKLTATRLSLEQYQIFDKQAVLGSLMQLLEEFDSSTEKLALLRKKPYRDEQFARGRSFSREPTAVHHQVKVVRVAGRSQDINLHNRYQPKVMPSAITGTYGRPGQAYKAENFRPAEYRYSNKQPSSSYRYMNYSESNDYIRELPANNIYTNTNN